MAPSLDMLPIVWWLLFALVNGFSFSVMLWDKAQSRKSGAERVSEGTLFFLATCFGSVGVFLGMFAFRHKTRHVKFLIGIPLLILQNIATLIVCSSFLSEGI